MKRVRQAFAIAALVATGVALGIPDGILAVGIPVSKMILSIATALNGVNLYLIKEEEHETPP